MFTFLSNYVLVLFEYFLIQQFNYKISKEIKKEQIAGIQCINSYNCLIGCSLRNKYDKQFCYTYFINNVINNLEIFFCEEKISFCVCASSLKLTDLQKKSVIAGIHGC